MKNARRTLVASTTAIAVTLSLLAPIASADSTDPTSSVVPSTLTVAKRHKVNLDKVVAGALKISVKQLRTELRAGATLAQVAANHGSTPEELTAAVKTAINSTVKAAVAAGSIRKSAATGKAFAVSGNFAVILNRGIESESHGETGKLDLFSESKVATLLGITLEQLRTELRSGISIATAATNHGVGLDTLKAALTADATAKIAAAVTAGKITQDQADVVVASLATRIDTYINRVQPPRMGYEKPKPSVPVELQWVTKDDVAAAIGITTTQLDTELHTGISVATVAVNHNVTVDALTASLTTTAKAKIAAAVTAGKITQTQADAFVASLPTLISSIINKVHEVEGAPKSPAPTFAVRLDDATERLLATTIGISKDRLEGGLKYGRTIAQIATDNGKTVDVVEAALTTAYTARINAAVTAGTITQTQADSLIAALPAQVTAFVNQVFSRR